MQEFLSSRFGQAGQWRAAQEQAQNKMLAWLSSGLQPRQLAFTLALGFAIGCIPLLGVTTAICALLALVLKLNMPAIQAANWVAMPLQLVLLIPFLRLGQWLFHGHSVSGHATSFAPGEVFSQMEAAPWHALMQMS